MKAAEYLAGNASIRTRLAVDTAERTATLKAAEAEVEHLHDQLTDLRSRSNVARSEVVSLARALACQGVGIKVRHLKDASGNELPFNVTVSTAFAAVEVFPRPTSRSGKTVKLEPRLHLWGFSGTLPQLPFSGPPQGTSSASLLGKQYTNLLKEVIIYLADHTAEAWLEDHGIEATCLEPLLSFDIRLYEQSVYQMRERITWLEPSWDVNLGGVTVAQYTGDRQDKKLGIDRKDMPRERVALLGWANALWPVIRPALLDSLRAVR